MSSSVCVTWAGPERTATPRPLSVLSWWDPLPPSQVELLTLSPLTVFNPSPSPLCQCKHAVYFQLFVCLFVCILFIAFLWCFSAHYIHWTILVILFVCHYFHTHSLSTGWCLWRSDSRSDLSSFFIVFVLPSMLFTCPLPLIPQRQHTSLWLLCSTFECYLEWNLLHMYVPLGAKVKGWQQFSCLIPLVLLLHFSC